VAEAIAATEEGRFQLVPITLGIRKKMSSTVHLSLADSTGDSAIIEYVGGKAKIYHGRNYTVMTNSPTFDQQLELARQYKGLGGDKPLPGTSSAHDRFVRASYYVKYLPGPKNYREAVAGVLSVMLNVSAPFGVNEPGKPNISSTIFRTVADLTNGIYYYESTLSPNIVWLDLRKLNLAAGAPMEELDLIAIRLWLAMSPPFRSRHAIQVHARRRALGRVFPGFAGGLIRSRRLAERNLAA
jgi:choloylglycine hydrolase